MTAKLFEPYTIKNVTLKNRIVMSPMCMYSAEADGKVNDFHLTHYISRAAGQVGLIMVEASGVTPQGRISENDLGIWSDEQIPDLRKLVDSIKQYGAKTSIQIAHAGRKSKVNGDIIAPSSIPFDENSKTPKEMTKEEIKETIQAFQDGAKRALQAGFDTIELHAAHGYLINEFLSPLSNKRDDKYGEDRYLFLEEIINAVKEVWDGPLFVRISATDHHKDGLTVEDYIEYSKKMKAQGIDLIDCSTGALVNTPINVYPGYQVPYAEKIRQEANIPTGAVGLITHGIQAEEILQNERADLIFIARELLRDPYWPRTAAKQLGTKIEAPKQYSRGW
ncbi:NADPH dehydrogenase NamA [Metabacillus fastidiosus]|uniref:NADPH dehydrogenase NamA n=1 Tax=Metabacillus fastidiosus TaxID=1458 RepID=UPI002E1E6987|nr:NADPH dehydrogenase NamA [Metabacillus fastidiosus]